VTFSQGVESELLRFDFFCDVEVREEVCAKESGKTTRRDRRRAKTTKICFILFN